MNPFLLSWFFNALHITISNFNLIETISYYLIFSWLFSFYVGRYAEIIDSCHGYEIAEMQDANREW